MAQSSRKRRSRRTPATARPPALSGRFREVLSVDRILLYCLAFVLFALPLFIWPGITEYGYGKTMFALIAISGLSILWGFSALRKGSWIVRLPWITFPFLGVVLASLLSLVHATNGRVVIQSLVLVVFFFQLLLIVTNSVRTQRDVNTLLSAMLASAFLASLYGLLQYLGVMSGPSGGTGLSEVITTLGNRNFLGGFLSYLLCPMVVLILRPRSRVLRVLAILLISFNFGTMLLAEQAGAIASAAAASGSLLVGWLIFRPIEPVRANRVWLIALLAVLVFTYLVEAPSGPLNSVVGLSAEDGSWVNALWTRNAGRTRELDWWIGWEMLKRHPLTGVGLGNYKLNFLPYKADFLATPTGEIYRQFPRPRAGQAHSEYIQVAAELGILGILAVVGFLATLATSLWIRLRRSTDEYASMDLLLLGAGVAAFLIHAVVSFPAHLPASSLAFILFVGLIHAPAYGDAGVVTVRLRRWGLRTALGAMLVLGIAVSIFAARDLRANILMGEGEQLLQLGYTTQAEELLTQSLRFDFAPRQTYYFLGTAQAKLGNYEQALATLEQSFTRFVDEAVYLVYADIAVKYGEIEKAKQAVAILLAAPSNEATTARALYIRASIAILETNYTEALALLQQLATEAPDFELAFIALGDVYRGLGREADAQANYEQALHVITDRFGRLEKGIAGRTRFTSSEVGQLKQNLTTLDGELAFIQQQLARFVSAETLAGLRRQIEDLREQVNRTLSWFE